MNVAYINPFIEAVDNVFRTMLRVSPTRSSIRISDGNGDGVGEYVTALVGITGQVGGVVVLRFSPKSALGLASRMAGAEFAELNAEVVDAIAELANMVAGSAKAKFELDPPLQLGLPTVVQGSAYKVKYPSNATWIEVPFTTELGQFTLEITFSSN